MKCEDAYIGMEIERWTYSRMRREMVWRRGEIVDMSRHEVAVRNLRADGEYASEHVRRARWNLVRPAVRR